MHPQWDNHPFAGQPPDYNQRDGQQMSVSRAGLLYGPEFPDRNVVWTETEGMFYEGDIFQRAIFDRLKMFQILSFKV